MSEFHPNEGNMHIVPGVVYKGKTSKRKLEKDANIMILQDTVI